MASFMTITSPSVSWQCGWADRAGCQHAWHLHRLPAAFGVWETHQPLRLVAGLMSWLAHILRRLSQVREVEMQSAIKLLLSIVTALNEWPWLTAVQLVTW